MASTYQGVVNSSPKTQIAILVGLGLGVAGYNLKEKIISQIKALTSKKSSQEIRKRFENLSEQEMAIEVKRVLTCYSKEFEESKILEKIVEKKVDEQTLMGKLSNDFSYTHNDLVQEDLVASLSVPIWEMLIRGGKRIRPIFCALIAEAYNHKFSEVIDIAGFIEVLHNCSLIIDDIEDGSLKRREKEAVHIMYGVDLSINAGNYGYFAPFNFLINQKKFSSKTIVQLSQIYAYEMSQIHFGQAWDLLWHSAKQTGKKIPNEQQYMQMVVNKTGALFRMMVKMLGVVLKLSKECVSMLAKFTEKMGAVFQIQDDIINLDSPDYTTKGIRGEDICEGKITVMVIHCLANQSEEKQQRLLEILSMKTQDQTIIDEAIEIIKESGSIQYAKELAVKIMNEAWLELDKSLPETEAKYNLKLICQFITKRSH